jgi:hypothetical protein
VPESLGAPVSAPPTGLLALDEHAANPRPSSDKVIPIAIADHRWSWQFF